MSDSDHPAADLDSIVVNPDDIIAGMRRNERDRDEQRTHVLRLTPPLEGEERAEPYVAPDNAYYPPDAGTVPMHIRPVAFLTGDAAQPLAAADADDLGHPDRATERARFRDEIGAHDGDGDYRRLTDEEEAQWDDCWGTVLSMWESRVRDALDGTESITFGGQHPEGGETTVAVRFED